MSIPRRPAAQVDSCPVGLKDVIQSADVRLCVRSTGRRLSRCRPWACRWSTCCCVSCCECGDSTGPAPVARRPRAPPHGSGDTPASWGDADRGSACGVAAFRWRPGSRSGRHHRRVLGI